MTPEPAASRCCRHPARRRRCCASPPTTSTRACAASGPRKRLEIHNLGLGVEALDADLVFLQEVRLFHTREARRFERTWFGWPEQGAGRLPGARGLRRRLPHQRHHAPRRARQRAAVALADRRHRPPRLSRPPLRAARPAARAGAVERRDACTPSSCTSGLIHASRVRQVQRLARFIDAAGAAPASCWSSPATSTTGASGSMRRCARIGLQRAAAPSGAARAALHLPVARAGVRARPHLHARPALHVDRSCRAARPGRACPTTCRWWPSWSRLTREPTRRRRGSAARRRRCGAAWRVAAPPSSSAATRCELLHGGDELFPAMRAAIAQRAARGLARHLHLSRRRRRPRAWPTRCRGGAARRARARGGRRLRLARRTLPRAARAGWPAAGVALAVFRPVDRWWSLLQPGQLRRLHQKLCVVDGEIAFVGGINIIDDRNDLHHGCDRCAAARLRGRSARPGGAPVAQTGARDVDARRARPRLARRGGGARAQRRADGAGAPRAAPPAHRCRGRSTPLQPTMQPVRAAFVVRDNLRQRRVDRAQLHRGDPRARERVDLVVAVLLSRPALSPRAARRGAARRARAAAAAGQARLPHRRAGRAGAVRRAAAARRAASSSTRRRSCTPRWRWSTTTGPPSAAPTSIRCRCC